MKDWWTARELAEARLPGVPGTQQGVQVLADRETWATDRALCRKRPGRGGGMEYHYTLLPEAARADLALRAAAEGARAARLPVLAAVPPADRRPLLKGAGIDRQDAKLTILSAFDAYWAFHAGTMSKNSALAMFVGLWTAGRIEAPAWARETTPRVSARTLWRWLDARRAGDPARLAGRYGNRAGSGRWDNDLAMVRDYLVALLCAQPHWSVIQLRNACRAKFCCADAAAETGAEVVMVSVGDQRRPVPLPALGEFQRRVTTWKETHITLFASFEAPDDYNSHHRLALGDQGAGIIRLNQVWMIDASPQDMITVEGRHSIYLLIDVWSRRVLILVTRTPRTEAMKQLLRRGLLDWGVPEELKTDNGSDFTSREALRVFAALGIVHVAATPYAPWEKGFVERAIGTAQKQLYPQLPGYCGANVAQAQKLRASKTFSQRLGESDREAFEVQLTATDAQRIADVWAAELYGRSPHGALRGLSPAARAASWGGEVRWVTDVRGLDMLLERVEGTRIPGKKGLRVRNRHYWSRELHPFLETREELEVRLDPDRPETVSVWRQDPLEFVGVAECLEMMTNERQAEIANAERAHQHKTLMDGRAGVRAGGSDTDRLTTGLLSIADQVKRNRRLTVVPTETRDVTHTSPELAAAGRAVRALAAPRAAESTPAEVALVARIEAEMAAPTPVPEAAEDRFARALALERRLAGDGAVTAEERQWLAGYQRGAEYRGHRRLYEDFGDQMLTTG